MSTIAPCGVCVSVCVDSKRAAFFSDLLSRCDVQQSFQRHLTSTNDSSECISVCKETSMMILNRGEQSCKCNPDLVLTLSSSILVFCIYFGYKYS